MKNPWVALIPGMIGLSGTAQVTFEIPASTNATQVLIYPAGETNKAGLRYQLILEDPDSHPKNQVQFVYLGVEQPEVDFVLNQSSLKLTSLPTQSPDWSNGIGLFYSRRIWDITEKVSLWAEGGFRYVVMNLSDEVANNFSATVAPRVQWNPFKKFGAYAHVGGGYLTSNLTVTRDEYEYEESDRDGGLVWFCGIGITYQVTAALELVAGVDWIGHQDMNFSFEGGALVEGDYSISRSFLFGVQIGW